IDAGNVVAVVGLKDAVAGSTVSDDKEMQPFEKIVHYSDPVVTIAVEAKSTSDLPKLVEALRLLAKADPSIQVEINQETGEHLISGMGELHLEITIYRVQNDYKIPVTTSPPIVVYREGVAGEGGPFEGKSPNKHNRFYMEVEPLEAKIDEDSVHRGPAQVIPAARSSIYGAMVQGGRILLEPIQKVFINVPQDYMGSAIGDIQSRRGVIEDINQEGEITIIHAKAPVAEMFGFASAIRSATQGRALWSTENSGFEAVPGNLQSEVVRAIRTRKGLPPEPYDEAYYAA